MRVALTGSTGFIGSHVLTELLDNGHEVVALVQGSPQADAVSAKGAKAAVVDLYDRSVASKVMRDTDGAIHTASPGDETSVKMDNAALDAAIEAFASTGKPYLQISGIWVYGNNLSITETSPMDSPALVAWRQSVEDRLFGADGVRAVVPVCGTAYGDGGGGVPNVVLGSPRDEAGNLIMIGTGQQHWATVHVADVAHFFRLALEDDKAQGYYVLADGANSTVADVTRAAAVAVGAPGAVPGSSDEARQRLGDYFAEVLLLDQSTTADRAFVELGWQPTNPGLIEEYREGSYRK